MLDDVKARMSGLLDPIIKEEIVGTAEVLEVFNSPKFGQVAGCNVIEGNVLRNKPVRVLRDDIVIFEGELNSLRRFKEDVNEVKNGNECGMGIKNYKDIKPGDKIEVFDRKRRSPNNIKFMTSNRSDKVSDLLKKEISTIITNYVKDPRLKNINITAVKVSDDIGIATVFYSYW